MSVRADIPRGTRTGPRGTARQTRDGLATTEVGGVWPSDGVLG
ncbi:MAG: hypothetical protein ACR2I7_10045 [Geodermatophilaceae bacterium]